MFDPMSIASALAGGLGQGIGGGGSSTSTATGGRGPTLGNYAKGGNASSGLDPMQIAMIAGAALFGLVLLKKVKK